ncbi:N-acetylmuramoyl-L-alanine amidase [Halobacillus mangrovi]|uniref:N-acetylmuramoyl-L-alanine amidase n=1 Tax=Halobacillus mangrovi TaxID=402384 RepID=UPI003D994ADF
MLKKGIFLFILLTIALTGMPEASVQANVAVIKVDNLNVRSGPGTDYERVAQVHEEETYSVLETEGDWVKIGLDSQSGWVAKWMVTFKGDRAANVSSASVSKVNYLRIRSEAGLKGKVKGYLMKGDEVELEKQEGNWYYVTHEQNKGWVHGDYLSKTDGPTSEPSEVKGLSTSNKTVKGKIKVGTTVLNVRSSNSLKGEVLTRVYQGKVFNYIDKKDRWYQIKWSSGKTGWVAGWLVNELEEGSTSNSSASEVTIQYNGTNLRSEPTTNGNVLARVHKGDRFDVVDQQGQWYRIKYKNKSAFVASWIVNEKKEETRSPSNNVSGNLKGRTIMIDAGHGGRDSGAIGFAGTYEKTMTMNTALALRTELQKSGAKVLMSRESDEYIPLSIRGFYSNASKADVFISLHYNSAPIAVNANGINSFYYHSKDKELAASVQEHMVASTGLRDRGTLHGNFHVLRENKKPSILLELGFISNPREEQTVRSSIYQRNASKGITQGLIDFFN